MRTRKDENAKTKKVIKNTAITLSDNKKTLLITADLPDVTEENISVYLEDNSVTITALDDKVRYQKTIKVPSGVRLYKKNFHDGVLELVLEKTGT